jgi:hypothetical protein
MKAQASREKITELENKLAANPRDGETQKQLMLEYNLFSWRRLF